MSEPTVQALHDLEVSGLRSKVSDTNERYKHALSLYQATKRELELVLGIKDSLEGNPPKHIRVLQQQESESVANLVGSDWHLEERIDPKTVNELNEYNPDIAQERIEKFFQNGLSMVEMCRTRNHISTLFLGLLGDIISGYIHEELAESNYLSPTEAILKGDGIIRGGIDLLLREGDFEKIIVVCCVGNHGRTTRQMRISTSTKNSFEWLLYQFLARAYAGNPKIEFLIADGYFVYADQYKTRTRWHHGDDVRYQGGVGGLTIPLNKAIAQWNKARPVDVDILGHWHTRFTQRDAVVNGSLIGYGPFSIHIKASYEPPQQSFFLVHPEYGKTVEIPIMAR